MYYFTFKTQFKYINFCRKQNVIKIAIYHLYGFYFFKHEYHAYFVIHFNMQVSECFALKIYNINIIENTIFLDNYSLQKLYILAKLLCIHCNKNMINYHFILCNVSDVTLTSDPIYVFIIHFENNN